MSKILIACSGFKDVLPAKPLCEILKASLFQIDSSLDISILPLSDGGEGFLQTLSSAFPPEKFSIREIEVVGPLGLSHIGTYGVLTTDSSRVGVVELAKVSGIEYVDFSLRNPYFTTSHGTGQTLKHIYNQGIKEIYLGLGGSATTDGGLSVLYALEALEFQFSIPNPLYLTGSHLKYINSISLASNQILSDLKITLACDVNNPMLGLNGSANIFGPQKGIQPDMMEEYENLMIRVNQLLTSIKERNIGNSEFSGAAGGISGGIMACFDNITVKKGIDIICQALGLEQKILESNFVITGEGCYDKQTKGGKVVSKIRELCPDSIIVCGINRSEEINRVYDLNSRFGERSITAVNECLKEISKEIYSNLFNN